MSGLPFDAAGTLRAKRAPPASPSPMELSPPWARAIPRDTARPSPVPEGLVVRGLEHAGARRGGGPGTAVAHRHLDRAGRRRHADPDAARAPRRLGRVLHQVHDDLPEALAVPHRGAGALHGDLAARDLPRLASRSTQSLDHGRFGVGRRARALTSRCTVPAKVGSGEPSGRSRSRSSQRAVPRSSGTAALDVVSTRGAVAETGRRGGLKIPFRASGVPVRIRAALLHWSAAPQRGERRSAVPNECRRAASVRRTACGWSRWRPGARWPLAPDGEHSWRRARARYSPPVVVVNRP